MQEFAIEEVYMNYNFSQWNNMLQSIKFKYVLHIHILLNEYVAG